MASRAYWKGIFASRLSRSALSFIQLSRATRPYRRIRPQTIGQAHPLSKGRAGVGKVDTADIIKDFEIETNEYVTRADDQLDAIIVWLGRFRTYGCENGDTELKQSQRRPPPTAVKSGSNSPGSTKVHGQRLTSPAKVKIKEKSGGSEDYLIIRNRAGLVGAAQIGGLELHVASEVMMN